MQNTPSDVRYTLALRPGVLLADRFRLVRPLAGSSAFAVTYLAQDEATGASAVVKEFFPRSLVGRDPDGVTVRPHSPEDQRDFVRSLRRFVHEGALLAEINHPHLVRARQLVEANGTAYLVMDVCEGQSLSQYVQAAGGRLPPAHAATLVQNILSALEPLHADSVIHRDLSPQSVHVLGDGRPILLAFPARRHVLLHGAEVTPGFAAFEQYGTRDVGPWTDVYAAAALLYYLLTGTPPASALDRAAGAALPSPAAYVRELAPSLAMVVLRGLSLLPQQRPHSASEMRRYLESTLGDAAAKTSTDGSGYPLDVTSMVTQAVAETADGSAGSLKLAAGGIVVPNEPSGTSRIFRRLGDAAARIREQFAENPPAEAPRERLPETPAQEREKSAPPPRPAAEPADVPLTSASAVALALEGASGAVPAPDVAAPLPSVVPPTQVLAELQRAQQAMQATPSTRRRTIVAAAAGVVLVLGTSAVFMARSGRLWWRGPGWVDNPTPAVSAGTESAQSGGDAARPRDPLAAGAAVLQSVAKPDSSATFAADSLAARNVSHSSATTAAPRAPVANRPVGPVTPLNISIPTAQPELKIIPPELFVDLRTRLSNGRDQADQGEYALARRTFRTTLQQLDSAAARYPDSQALRSLRKEIEQADEHTLQACNAENELHRRRGEQPGACQ